MKFSNMTAVSVWLLSITFVACQPSSDVTADDPDGGIKEDGLLFAPKPREAIPGSLGGICGKEFSQCQTEATAKNRFEGLKKSSWKLSCTPNEASGLRVAAAKFNVPRLVNDHSEKSDTLAVEVSEYNVGNLRPESGTVALMFYRNGVRVAEQFVRTHENGGPVLIDQFLDARRGGVETVLAFGFDPTSVMKRIGDAVGKCGDKPTVLAYNGRCAHCYFKKVAALGLLGAINPTVGAIAGVSATTKAGVGVATAGAAATIGILFSCEAECARGKCDSDFRECRKTTPKPQCAGTYEGCCRAAKGRCVPDRDGDCAVCVANGPFE